MRKHYLLLLIIVLISCGEDKTQEEVSYSHLLNQPISNEEIQEFMNQLGSEYEYSENYGRHSYIYDTKGVEMTFTEGDSLKAIFFKNENLPAAINIPYGITMKDTRKDIIEKVGEPDKTFVGLNDMSSYYLDKNLVVKYQSKDTVNLNNGIKSVSISQLDRERILAN